MIGIEKNIETGRMSVLRNCERRRRSAYLCLRLTLTPEMVNTLADPKEAQAVPKDAQNSEVAQEYGVAHRKPDADKNNARNNAFHNFVKMTTVCVARASLMPIADWSEAR
jgi:hypothetical protein